MDRPSLCLHHKATPISHVCRRAKEKNLCPGKGPTSFSCMENPKRTYVFACESLFLHATANPLLHASRSGQEENFCQRFTQGVFVCGESKITSVFAWEHWGSGSPACMQSL